MTASGLDRALSSLLGWLTDDPRVRRNVFWLGISQSLLALGTLVVTRSSAITRAGLTADGATALALASPVVLQLGCLAFLGLADYVDDRVQTYVFAGVIFATAPLALAVLVTIPRSIISPSGAVGFVTGADDARALLYCVLGFLAAAVIVRALPVGIRGRYLATVAVVTTLGTQGLSAALERAGLTTHAPHATQAAALVAAFGLILLGALAFARVREVPELAVPGASRSALPFAAIADIVQLKEFHRLAPPLVLRGMMGGAGARAVALGLGRLNLPAEYSEYATAGLLSAAVLGSTMIFLVADRWGAARTTLLAGALTAVGMGTMLPAGNPEASVTLWAVMQLGLYAQIAAVNLGLLNTAPPGYMGAFFAAQALLWFAGAALEQHVVRPLCGSPGEPLLLGIVAVLTLANGVWYWWAFGGTATRASVPDGAEEGQEGGAVGQ